MAVKYETRAYFKTELFNRISNDFNEIILSNLIRHFKSISGKGSSRFEYLSDMPYHIHIINGIYPSLLLLEKVFTEKNIRSPLLDKFIKSFILGYTLHDLNKLTGENDLKKAVDENLENYLLKLEVGKFFPEWQEYLNEIKFIILKTEERTRNLANDIPIKERQFVNDFLAEASQLADKFGSIRKSGWLIPSSTYYI